MIGRGTPEDYFTGFADAHSRGRWKQSRGADGRQFRADSWQKAAGGPLAGKGLHVHHRRAVASSSAVA